MNVLSLDPNLHGFGVGDFRDNELIKGWYEPLPNADDPWTELAVQIHAVSLLYGGRIVTEQPQIYDDQNPGTKGDRNDLISVAQIGTWVTALIRSDSRAVSHEFVLPHTWTGSVPKDAKHPLGPDDVRGRRIWGILTKEEQNRVVFPKAKRRWNDVLDGIGIGLWRLGRYGRP